MLLNSSARGSCREATWGEGSSAVDLRTAMEWVGLEGAQQKPVPPTKMAATWLGLAVGAQRG